MKRSLAITILLFASSQAIATVTEWSGAPGGDFTIDADGNVTILAAGTFKFQSVTVGNLDSIRSISVANGVTGYGNGVHRAPGARPTALRGHVFRPAGLHST